MSERKQKLVKISIDKGFGEEQHLGYIYDIHIAMQNIITDAMRERGYYLQTLKNNNWERAMWFRLETKDA